MTLGKMSHQENDTTKFWVSWTHAGHSDNRTTKLIIHGVTRYAAHFFFSSAALTTVGMTTKETGLLSHRRAW